MSTPIDSPAGMANVEDARNDFEELEYAEFADDERAEAYLDEHPYRFAVMIGIVVGTAILTLRGAEFIAAVL